MKGIANRQKTVVRPRESVQKFITQQKDFRRSGAASDRGSFRKEVTKTKK